MFFSRLPRLQATWDFEKQPFARMLREARYTRKSLVKHWLFLSLSAKDTYEKTQGLENRQKNN